MTNNNHPITPPPELVEQWYEAIDNSSTSWKQELATQAARWGADQELHACCEWLLDGKRENLSQVITLRSARRPKPPSLKEQALVALRRQSTRSVPSLVATNDCDLIRRALESLPD